MRLIHLSLSGICLALLSNFASADNHSKNPGRVLFEQNCATCHEADAATRPQFSLHQLKEVVRQGSIQIGGSMPGFKGILSDREIDLVIAHFLSDRSGESFQQKVSQKTATVSQDKSPDEDKLQDIMQLLRFRLGTNDVAPAVETEIEGVYQTSFGNKYAYLIEDGRYVFIGDLVDLKRARNITEIARRTDVRNTLAGVPLTDLVVFPARGEERTVLNVFTDTSCAYCQKLHTEIGHLQDAGISVHYFPFPRGGNRGPGYQALKSVWCAKDGMKAMDIAKGVSSGDLPDGNCDRSTSVDRGYDLGVKVGISGTPALFSANGTKFNGYVPHNELIPMLLNELQASN